MRKLRIKNKKKLFIYLVFSLLFFIFLSFDNVKGTILYTESFDSETGEMSHNYYPDTYNSTYLVSNNLTMTNSFPNQTFVEDLDIPTYTFTDDTVGGNPAGWTVYESGGTVNVIAGIGGREKVVELHDTSGADRPKVSNTLDDNYTSGTVDYYIRTDDSTKTSDCIFMNYPAEPFIVRIDDGYFQHKTGGAWTNSSFAISNDTWYHFSIDFECGDGKYTNLSADDYRVTIDGTLIDTYDFISANTKIDTIRFSGQNTPQNYYIYVDEVYYSWFTLPEWTLTHNASQTNSYFNSRGVFSSNITNDEGDIYALGQKTINYTFLDRYDANATYQKLYNVTTSFTYTFTNYTMDASTAICSLNGTEYPLNNVEGTYSFSESFEFSSSSASNFTLIFNITSCMLEFSNMNHSICFNCLDVSGYTVIYQNFTLIPTFTITTEQKTTGTISLNFTINFTASSDLDKYSFYNGLGNNDRNNSLFVYILNIQHEDGWYEYGYETNSSMSQIVIISITDILDGISKSQFLNFTITFYISGNPSTLTIDNLGLVWSAPSASSSTRLIPSTVSKRGKDTVVFDYGISMIPTIIFTFILFTGYKILYYFRKKS